MELNTRRRCRLLGVLLALPLAAWPAGAQEQEPAAALAMDLNGLSQTENGCRLTFVVENRLTADIDEAIFEFALFGRSGLVARLLTLDFKDLPKGRTRVRQFDLVDLECGRLARILVNDTRDCSGPGVAPSACMRDLETSTATDLKFGN